MTANEELLSLQLQPTARALRAGRILVVDDYPMIRFVAGAMLENLGYQPEFAREGAEAVEQYQQARESGRPFAAVIIDLTIPGGMGGKEAVRKLVEMDPQAKVIVSSGYSNDPVMAEYRDYGFSGVLPKPYMIEKLRDVLQEVLGGAQR